MLAQDPLPGGAIGRCEAPYLLELLGLAAIPEAYREIRGDQHAVAALAPWSTEMTLPGFTALPGDTTERIYLLAIRDRLRSVKNHYDPGGVILPSFPS